MIDWTKIKLLRNEIGADSFPEVVELFLEEVAETIDRLRTDPKLETIGDDLHAMKGSALNLGFRAFSEMCQAGETKAARGRADEIVLSPILQCYDDSRDIFLAGLANGDLG